MKKNNVILTLAALVCCSTLWAQTSGNNSPSRLDDKLTERIRKACDIMRIYFLDHVIVCDGSYYSYREKGRL